MYIYLTKYLNKRILIANMRKLKLTKKKIVLTMQYLWYYFVPLAMMSVLNGAIIGAIVCLYGIAANWLVHSSQSVYIYVREHAYYVPLLFLGLIVLALIMTAFLKKTPSCKGSGVPRVEGVLRNILTFKWLRTLITTVFATMCTYIGGLSLGSEGPSIQIGASIAQGSTRLKKSPKEWHKHVLTGGASAGLATAFNAPLTGIVFAVEEVHKQFAPMLLISSAITVIAANIVSVNITRAFGINPLLFDFGALPDVPMKFVWALFILGLVIGICALAFNKLIFKANKYSNKYKKIPLSVKLIMAFILSGAIGLLMVDTVGGGHTLIEKVAALDYSSGMMVALFIVKLFLIIVCFSSGATGGLFVPMLTLGALLGGITARLLMLIGLEPQYFTTVVVIAMTAFFGASVRAPLTAIILIVEVTGQLSGFLMTSIAIFTAYFIPLMFKVAPLYDGLLEDLVEQELPLNPPPYKGGVGKYVG